MKIAAHMDSVRKLELELSATPIKSCQAGPAPVSTDYPTVAWKLRGRSGTERTGTLHFRAPRSVGYARALLAEAL